MNNRFLITQKQLKTFMIAFVLKLLYEISIQLLLPERYLLWSFNKNINWENLIIEMSIFLLVSLYFCMNFCDISPFNFFSTILFVMYFIPTNSSLVLSNVTMDYYILSNIFASILFLVLGYLTSSDKRRILKHESDNSQTKGDIIDNIIDLPAVWLVVRMICILVCLATLLYVYKYNGLNLVSLFNDMYSVRSEYASYASNMTGSLSSYLTLIVTRLGGWILPLYLYFALKKKKLFDIGFSIFTFIANFTVEMQKNSLMIVFIVIGIVCIEKCKKINNISIYVLYLFAIMILISLCEYWRNGESVIFTTFIRRMFYIPAYMNEKYYQFFVLHKKIFFTQDAFFIQNILQKLFGRAYGESSVAVISRVCFNGELPSPNTGLFAEAYSQLGILGVGIFPFIYGYVAKAIYKVANFYGRGALYVIFFKLALTMVSVFTLTSSTFVGILLFIGVTIFAQILSKSV